MKNTKIKRVLVVCQHYWPEPFRVNDICDYFIENGYEVDVLCGIPNYPGGKFYKDYSLFSNRTQQHEGINVFRAFEIPRGSASPFFILLNNVSFIIGTIFRLPKLLTKKYDYVFIYQLSPVIMALPGIIIGKIKRIPVTMWVIDIWPDNVFSYLKIKNRVLRWVLTVVSHWHYKRADRLIALTDSMRQLLITATGKSKDSIITLPQSCEKLYESKPKLKQFEDRFKNRFNILFTGTLTPILSLETVVYAAEILNKRGLANIMWVIVGDGTSRYWLESEVTKRGLKDNFLFEGQKLKEEIPIYTTYAADVLLSTLVKDPLLEVTVPSKIASYLATGKPLVLAMDGEANQLINEIGCGFAGPAEDAAMLASNIEKLYKMSAKQRAKLGQAAFNYYINNLERSKVMKKLENFALR